MNKSVGIDGVIVSRLKIIEVAGGDVLHGVKNSDEGYVGFGEAYFSMADRGAVKAWKRHRQMTMNLVVPIGAVRFVLFDDRRDSLTRDRFQEIVIGRENYVRLTVPPMLWMGFQGVDAGPNLLLNLADITHDPAESDRRDPSEIDYDWSLS